MCRDSMCVPQCKADEECALNERCSKGACLCKWFENNMFIWDHNYKNIASFLELYVYVKLK